MKLIIQIPCFNEEENISSTINSIPEHFEGIDEVEIMIVDDGSTDKTIDVANWNERVNHIVKQNRHTGLANTFRVGLNEAIKRGADIIVNTDADNQYCAEDIQALINPILNGQADMVIGARPISSINGFSPLKKMLQKLGSAFMRLVSSTNVDDAPSGFRAFTRETASILNVFDNYTYTMETIIQAKAKGLKIVSVPVRVNDNYRKSRLVKNMFLYIRNSFCTMMRMFIVYRPFRFFLFFALIFLTFGLVLAGRFLYFYYTVGGAGHIQSLIFSAILIISGIQIGLIGVLADLSAINRKLLEDIQLRVKKIENK